MNMASDQYVSTCLQRACGMLDAGQPAEAKRVLAELAGKPVTQASDHQQMGQLYSRLQDYPAAAACYSRALMIHPRDIALLNQQAGLYLTIGQFQQASGVLNTALALDPAHAQTLATVGGMYLLLRQFDHACEWLEKAIHSDPAEPANYINLAQALASLGRHEEAIQRIGPAITLDPHNPKAHFALGRALMDTGKMQEAIAHFEQAIQLHPEYGLVYHLLSQIKKFSAADAGFIQQAEVIAGRELRPIDLCSLHFALGKMYDDTGEYARAFAHFTTGNQLVQHDIHFDINQHNVINQTTVCTRKNLATRHSGNTSDVPVFVVGMPRSGTTLLEQIICSHAQAAGAGELRDIAQIAGALFAECQKPFFPWLSPSPPAQAMLDKHANHYLATLRKTDTRALRIVDKMPENYYWLGTIALLFPHARIIHAVRHPLDTCLSCYFQMFTEIGWASSLKQIAHTYRAYRTLMDHWKATLPPGMIVDVHYEDIIAEPEPASRHLINLCGLPWDPQCLAFFNTERNVMTSSVWQVRQPIYQSSKMRWIHYAPFLGELANDLADFLQDDRDILQQHGITLHSTGVQHAGN